MVATVLVSALLTLAVEWVVTFRPLIEAAEAVDLVAALGATTTALPVFQVRATRVLTGLGTLLMVAVAAKGALGAMAEVTAPHG